MQPNPCKMDKKRLAGDKLAALANLDSKSLTAKTHMKSALGLIKFFRSFIHDCERIALPLTELLRKTQPYKVQ
jgi:hypothetical protein